MNKILSFITCLITSTCFANYNTTDWVELEKIYVRNTPNDKEEKALRVIFVNSYTEVGPKDNEWHVVNVSHLVPEDAKAIFLVGILLITHGSCLEIANLQLYFRPHGSDENVSYIVQIIEASLDGGQRVPFSIWLPLSEDKKFEFKWTRTNPGQWPHWSAYGINLSINAWGK